MWASPPTGKLRVYRKIVCIFGRSKPCSAEWSMCVCVDLRDDEGIVPYCEVRAYRKIVCIFGRSKPCSAEWSMCVCVDLRDDEGIVPYCEVRAYRKIVCVFGRSKPCSAEWSMCVCVGLRDDEGIVPYRMIVIVVNAKVGVDAHIDPNVILSGERFGRSKPLPYGVGRVCLDFPCNKMCLGTFCAACFCVETTNLKKCIDNSKIRMYN